MKSRADKTEWLIRLIAEGDAILCDDSIRHLARQLEMRFFDCSYFCAVVRYAGDIAPEKNAELPLTLLRSCRVALKNLSYDSFCYIGDGLCAVMLLPDFQNDRQAVIERLRVLLQKCCSQPVQLGIGRSYEDLGKLSYSRVEAYEALQSIGSAQCASYIDDIYVMRSLTTRKLESEKRKIIELFKSGRLEEMMANLTELAEIVRSESPVRDGMPYPTSIRRTILELLFEIMHIGSDAGVDVDAILGYEDPYSRVFSLTGTPLILAWFSDIADALYRSICERSSQNRSNFLSHAMQCIDEHLSDPELSLSLVSDQLSITPTYFSALFIRETGIGFNEYITGLRIDRAKKLLTVSNRKINDIALECGFRSASYFIVVFRKQTGMSPGEFRNKKL